MKKIVGLVFGFVPFSINAQCIQAPDCASIGYTETSCDGDSLKCPFDISKLYCVPCDSSFKYSCDGENVLGGVGSSCAGKYVICDCDEEAGYNFDNGNCICDSSCSTAGNMFYSDGTCSSCLYNDKTVAGVVVGDGVVASIEIPQMYWSPDCVDIESLANYGDMDAANDDYSGYENTQIIVQHYGENADVSKYAGVYCYNYAPSSMPDTQGQWYLPAGGELTGYIGKNYQKIKATWEKLGIVLPVNKLWSSSEFSSHNAWYYSFPNSKLIFYFKHRYSNSIICFLKI